MGRGQVLMIMILYWLRPTTPWNCCRYF